MIHLQSGNKIATTSESDLDFEVCRWELYPTHGLNVVNSGEVFQRSINE